MSSRVYAVSLLASLLLLAALYREWSAAGRIPSLRSEHSRPALVLPARRVAITAQGKTFHDPGCRYLHGRVQMVTAEAAVRGGYTPCVRCMREALPQ